MPNDHDYMNQEERTLYRLVEAAGPAGAHHQDLLQAVCVQGGRSPSVVDCMLSGMVRRGWLTLLEVGPFLPPRYVPALTGTPCQQCPKPKPDLQGAVDEFFAALREFDDSSLSKSCTRDPLSRVFVRAAVAGARWTKIEKAFDKLYKLATPGDTKS